MFTLTLFEAAALGIGLLATILLLVGGVLVAFPRATLSVPATVACPILHLFMHAGHGAHRSRNSGRASEERRPEHQH